MFTFTGIVQKGAKRAAELGFATINIPLGTASVSGVYAAKVNVEGKEYTAAVFADPGRGILEAHMLDFPPQDLYGKEATIELFEKLRDGMRFDNDEVLRSTIADDVKRTRMHFERGAK